MVALAAGGCAVDLGTLGGATSYAYDINNRGVVVGHADAIDAVHAFRRVPGRPLEDLNGSFWASIATAVNDNGVVVGFGGNFDFVALMWDADGTGRMLDTGPYSMATDVNNEGAIVGNARDGPFVRDAATGRIEILSGPEGYGASGAAAINEAGTIVGQVCDTEGCHAALWRARTHEPVLLPDPGDHPFSQATGINDRGTVVGSSYGPDGSSAVIWRAGSHRPRRIMPPDPGGTAQANDINNRDQVVGSVESRAVRWDLRSGRTTDLGGLGGHAAQATAINNAGVAVGWAATTDLPPPGSVSPPSHAVLFVHRR